jgi:hypothetical protein
MNECAECGVPTDGWLCRTCKDAQGYSDREAVMREMTEMTREITEPAMKQIDGTKITPVDDVAVECANCDRTVYLSEIFDGGDATTECNGCGATVGLFVREVE